MKKVALVGVDSAGGYWAVESFFLLRSSRGVGDQLNRTIETNIVLLRW